MAARSLLIVLLALSSETAAAEPVTVVVVGAGPGERIAKRSPIHARVGESVSLFAVVKIGRGRRARYFTDAPRLRLGRRISKRRIRPLSEIAQRVRWVLVEPRQFHVDTPSPNVGNPAYSNSVLFGPRHGKWLGLDALEYHETPIAGARTGALTIDRVRPTDRRLRWGRGAGTMRYKVVIEIDGKSHASPGADAVGPGGITGDVMRVSLRHHDGFGGHLTSYFNVPNVFGSAGRGSRHQTDRYQGADCADVIVGAARRAGAKIEYTHAAGLTRYARRLGGLLRVHRRGVRHADEDVAATLAVRQGDLVLIDYSDFDGSGRKWDHVAVVAAPGQSTLSPDTPVWHIGFKTGLREEPLHRQGRATIQVLRFRPGVRRRFRR